jgi:hypothetical protein
MKLITEYLDKNLSYITEGKDKDVYIEGVFMQAESVNRNGRIYPKPILESAVETYVTEQVKRGRAVGELNHPEGPTINLDKVSHKIVSLKWTGNDVVGKALILDTPMGNIVKGLVRGGVQLGVSSRGMGSLERREGKTYVGKDFGLSTVDIVQDPSAPDAFVNGIMEGVEWIWQNGLLKPQKIEEYETEIRKAPSRRLYETKLNAFKDFLSHL